MTSVSAAVTVPGPADAVQALWLDPRRWPSLLDDFGAVQKVDGDWPRDGRVTWTSKPHGRGLVVEHIVDFDAGAGHEVEIEDERIRGRQLVTLTTEEGGDVLIEVRFEYRLKDRNPLLRIADMLFIRRSQRDALVRTLQRLAVERASDVSSA